VKAGIGGNIKNGRGWDVPCSSCSCHVRSLSDARQMPAELI
jgi:hypothetical protein